jgi:hypothetical protein
VDEARREATGADIERMSAETREFFTPYIAAYQEHWTKTAVSNSRTKPAARIGWSPNRLSCSSYIIHAALPTFATQTLQHKGSGYNVSA